MNKNQILNIQEDWLIVRMLIGLPVLAGMHLFILAVCVYNVISYAQ